VRLGHRGQLVLEIDALEIASGRVTAVTGANGTGKSTLLRALAFLHEPSAGLIEYRGEKVVYRGSVLTALRRSATYVAQAPLLFRRSVRANVAYGLRQRRQTEGGRVAEALRAVDLADFADRPAARLSGGETQRVCIARALAVDPLCYLLDEPTAHLDRATVPRIEWLIRALADAGRTVVLATHDLEQARRIGDRVLRAESGRVTASPDAERLAATTRSW
jgi:ABC-type sulfate/molybdate transport systems ATPase subunit